VTAYVLVWCIVAGIAMIGLGIWVYGPNGPDAPSDRTPR